MHVLPQMSLQKKKGKKRVDGGGGEVGGAQDAEATPPGPTPPVTSAPKVASRNLQELLHKMSVEEKSKTHEFWDTQPVPKLGEEGAWPGRGVA